MTDERARAQHERARRLRIQTVERQPPQRRRHRTGFFTDGRTLMWEYPRAAPGGEQMDFAEVMEIEDGLIVRHRVYWGWYGLRLLERDRAG